MKTLLLSFLFIPLFSFGQFQFTVEGMNSQTYTFENYTSEKIHTELKNWVNMNFTEPKNAIVADVEGRYFKIKGFAPDAACEKEGKECYSMQYFIEFKIKDNKMTATPKIPQIKSPTFGYRNPQAHWFKKDGTPKNKNIKTIQLAGNFFDRMLSRINNSIKKGDS